MAKAAKPSRRTWRLTLTGSRWYDVDGDKDKGFLCVDKLCELFDVPLGTHEIWVTLYDRPGADRVEVSDLDIDSDVVGAFARVDGGFTFFDYAAAVKVRRFLAGRRRCWAGVEYRPNQK